MSKVVTTLTAATGIATSSITNNVIDNDVLTTVIQILIGIVTLVKLLKKDKTTPKS